MVIDGPSRFDRVRGVREMLTATGAGLYLATHQAGPVPAEAVAAAHESDDMELRVGRVGPDRAIDLDQREREARAVVAAVLGASPDQVVLTHGAAEAARLAAIEVLERRVDDARDGRVLLVRGLDPTIAAAIRDVADVAGAEVEVLDAPPTAVEADISMVAMSRVDADGRLADPRPVGRIAAEARARLLLDVSRSAGALPTDVGDLAADFVIAETHRWLLGPEGVAAMWLTPRFAPELPTWLRQACAPFARGTLLSLARAVGWLLMYVELPWVLDRTQSLAERLYDGLGQIDGVELMAPADAHGAVAAFRIPDWDAPSAAEELSRSIFAIVEADLEADLLRASVGAWNRESEVDRFVARVAELANHTPETLPRRPSLTILSGPLDAEDEP